MIIKQSEAIPWTVSLTRQNLSTFKFLILQKEFPGEVTKLINHHKTIFKFLFLKQFLR